MSIETIISLGALVVAIAGAIYSGRKSSADIKNMKVDRENTLGEIIARQDKSILELRTAIEAKDARLVELERKFTDLSAYVGELLAGIDMLIEQITVKHKDTPVWHPNRRHDDPK